MSPEINWMAQKYMTNVLDFIKMKMYNHVKVAMPQDISQNKIVVLGQYVSKLEKVRRSARNLIPSFSSLPANEGSLNTTRTV